MMNVYNFSKRAAITAFVVLLIAAAFYLVGKHFYFFLLVFAGILLAVLFCGITDWLVLKVKLKRSIALTLAVISFFGIIIGTFWLVAPTVGEQVQEMRATVPQALSKVETWLSQFGWGERIIDRMPDNFDNAIPKSDTLLTQVSGVFSSTLSFLADLLIVLVTGLFFAANPGIYTKGLAKLFPVPQRGRILDVLDKCYENLKLWLLGMLAAMALTGVTAAIGYSLIGLPLAIALALLAFFGEFIPNVGPALAGVPAVLIGFTVSPKMAVYALLVYLFIQTVQSYIITPLIFQKTVDMPPALLLFFQVLLGIMQGGLGLLLAAPLLAVIMVLVNELYIKDVLETKHSSNLDML
jgi:predicted PurR-regulated permease PerM